MNREIDTKTYVEHADNVLINNSEKLPLPSNIPTPKGFIGREDELKILQKAKDSGKTSFVLHGAGGVGKTDLALEFIRLNKSGYEADIRIDMQGLSDNILQPKDAMLDVIRAFEPGVPADLSEPDIKKFYNSLLNQHKTILFFDNAKDREQVESLNNASAFIVVTSRTSFNVTGGFSKEIEQMSPEDARDLLYSIAEEERFGGQADALAHLAGYLPMALLPLAALLADDLTLQIQDLIQKYSDRKNVLYLKDPNRENLSIEASFDLSYETLSDELKERWRKLAVFPADFDLQAMQAIWKIEDGKETRSGLVQKHLLEFNQKTKRSRLHDLARIYTKGKLSKNETFINSFAHCLHYGRILASLQNVNLTNLKEFNLEYNNIEQGFAWLKNKVEQDEVYAQICLSYISSSHLILSLRLYPRNYIKWLETGLKASQKLNNQQVIGICLGNLGSAYKDLGKFQKAIKYNDQALTIAEEINDRQSKGRWLSNFGIVYQNLGQYQKAIKYHEQALTIAKEFNNPKNESGCLGNLGTNYLSLGEYQKAIEYQEQALAISKKTGDRHSEGADSCNLGNGYLKIGSYRKAIKYYDQALIIAREFSDQYGEENCLGNLGIAYSDSGEYQKGIEYLKQAIKIAKEIDNPKDQGTWTGNLGNIYWELGELQRAISYCDLAIKIAKKIGDPNTEGGSLNTLGSVYYDSGKISKAIDCYTKAIAVFEAIESPNAEIARHNLAILESEMLIDSFPI